MKYKCTRTAIIIINKCFNMRTQLIHLPSYMYFQLNIHKPCMQYTAYMTLLHRI